MGLIFDVGNGNNWVSRYSKTLQGAPAMVPGNYESIPPQIIPITFTGHLIAIFADSTHKKDTWFTAGWLWQRVLINIGTGATAPNATVQRKYKFYLGQLTILTIPKLASEYGLTISIPRWLTQIEFEIYEYVGEIIDTTEVQLEQIQADLLNLINDNQGGSADSETGLTTQQKATITYFTNFL